MSKNIYDKFKEPDKKKDRELSTKLSSNKNAEIIKFSAGENLIRFLPRHPKSKHDEFWHDTTQHWKLGKNQDTSITCRKVFNQSCPICQLRENVFKKFDKLKLDKEKGKGAKIYAILEATKPNRKIYAYVIDVKNDSEVIKRIGISAKLMKTIYDNSLETLGRNAISSIKKGRIVKIKREGTGLKTTYSQYLLNKSKSKDWAEIPAEILEALYEMKPLDSMDINVSDKEMKKLVKQTSSLFDGLIKFKVPKVTEDEETGEREDEDLEEEDEDLEEEDEDLEEEDDEEEDDEEEEDDDEEDEKKSKKKKKNKSIEKLKKKMKNRK